MEKHELDLVTSICTMSCNVRLQDYARHTRTLPLLIYLEVIRKADLHGLCSFIEAITWTRECALGKRVAIHPSLGVDKKTC
jgi:hypothetical protein